MDIKQLGPSLWGVVGAAHNLRLWLCPDACWLKVSVQAGQLFAMSRRRVQPLLIEWGWSCGERTNPHTGIKWRLEAAAGAEQEAALRDLSVQLQQLPGGMVRLQRTQAEWSGLHHSVAP